MVEGNGTRENPWQLMTPGGKAAFIAFRDPSLDPPALVVRAGKTELRYHLGCLEDLHTMLKDYGDWMPLGAADEQKPAVGGTVEAWARSRDNPVRGWYGLKKGLRGRFCRLCTAGDAGPRPRRGRGQPAQQSHARSVALNLPKRSGAYRGPPRCGFHIPGISKQSSRSIEGTLHLKMRMALKYLCDRLDRISLNDQVAGDFVFGI